VRVSDDVFVSFEQFESALHRDALDCSVVARVGVMSTLAQEWSRPGAAGDRENVESNRPSDYCAAVWEVIVENAASRVLRREDFRFKHAVVVRGSSARGV
jgi:hypothetical protein